MSNPAQPETGKQPPRPRGDSIAPTFWGGTMHTQDHDKLGSAGLSSFLPGSEVFGGFRLVERLGLNSAGEVWKATRPDGVPIALRCMEIRRPGAAARIRALSLMFPIRHPNLVASFGPWHQDGWVAIGMRLSQGTLLGRFEAAWFAGRPGLKAAELIDFIGQAAHGIDFLNEPKHQVGDRAQTSLVHRDIRPAHLLLFDGSVRVGGFDLAQGVVATHEAHLQPVDPERASPLDGFAAPELDQGLVSLRSDQYSLAATYCYLRSGQVPAKPAGRFDAADLTMLAPPERTPVARALMFDPGRRWPSCTAFVDALRTTSSLLVSIPTRATLEPPQRFQVDQTTSAASEMLASPRLDVIHSRFLDADSAEKAIPEGLHAAEIARLGFMIPLTAEIDLPQDATTPPQPGTHAGNQDDRASVPLVAAVEPYRPLVDPIEPVSAAEVGPARDDLRDRIGPGRPVSPSVPPLPADDASPVPDGAIPPAPAELALPQPELGDRELPADTPAPAPGPADPPADHPTPVAEPAAIDPPLAAAAPEHCPTPPRTELGSPAPDAPVLAPSMAAGPGDAAEAPFLILPKDDRPATSQWKPRRRSALPVVGLAAGVLALASWFGWRDLTSMTGRPPVAATPEVASTATGVAESSPVATPIMLREQPEMKSGSVMARPEITGQPVGVVEVPAPTPPPVPPVAALGMTPDQRPENPEAPRVESVISPVPAPPVAATSPGEVPVEVVAATPPPALPSDPPSTPAPALVEAAAPAPAPTPGPVAVPVPAPTPSRPREEVMVAANDRAQPAPPHDVAAPTGARPTLDSAPVVAEMAPPVATVDPGPPGPNAAELAGVINAWGGSTRRRFVSQAIAAWVVGQAWVRPMAALAARPRGPSGGEILAGLRGWAQVVGSQLGSQAVSAWRDGLAWLRTHPLPAQVGASPAIERAKTPEGPRTASIFVRMPSGKAELVVRGAVGRGNPDEWYGPTRVIHSPPLSDGQDYLVGAFWTDSAGRPATRSLPLRVEPGCRYEVDLRPDQPTAVEKPRSPEP